VNAHLIPKLNEVTQARVKMPALLADGVLLEKDSKAETRILPVKRISLEGCNEPAYRIFLPIGGLPMKNTFAVAAMATLLCAFSPAHAQTPETSYKADPDVYKVIFEDAKIRIIQAVRKAGVTDKMHSHPNFIVYGVTPCKTLQTSADGKSAETNTPAGTARALPAIAGHTAKNTGSEDCKQLFVEEK
jgi:hypothetical protein